MNLFLLKISARPGLHWFSCLLAWNLEFWKRSTDPWLLLTNGCHVDQWLTLWPMIVIETNNSPLDLWLSFRPIFIILTKDTMTKSTITLPNDVHLSYKTITIYFMRYREWALTQLKRSTSYHCVQMIHPLFTDGRWARMEDWVNFFLARGGRKKKKEW